MELQESRPVYNKNVLLFKHENITRSNGEVFTPILMELCRLRKTDQFKRDVEFHEDMSQSVVWSTLVEVFPVLRNTRFSCAATAEKNSPKLDFHGERRVWNGKTIKRKIKGNRCLYIVPEVEQVAPAVDSVRVSSPQPIQKETSQALGVGQHPQGIPWPVAQSVLAVTQSTSTYGGLQPNQKYQLQVKATPGTGTQLLQQRQPGLAVVQPVNSSAAAEPSIGDDFFPDVSCASLQHSTPPLVCYSQQLSQQAAPAKSSGNITDAFTSPNDPCGLHPSLSDPDLQLNLLTQMCASATVETGESSESDYYSGGNLQQRDQELEQQTTPQNGRAEIHVNWGPLEGGRPFQLLLIDIPLHDSVEYLRLLFGSNEVEVEKQRRTGLWLGVTPPGERYGTVTVIIMEADGNEIASTEYTYVDEEEQAIETVVRSRKLQWKYFNEFNENQSNAGLPGNSNAANRIITGEPKHVSQLQEVDVLRRMVYAAARIGAAQFVQMVFSTSNGPVVFQAYKSKSLLPEEIAEANSHNDLATYLRGITERFSNEDGTSQPRSNNINWLELLRAVEESEQTPGTCKATMKEVRKEDSSESAYFGDTEASSSDSDKEKSDSEDIFKGVVSKACPIQLGLERNYVMREKDIHNYQLPDDTGDKWKDLARALRFSEAIIKSIEMEKGNSLKECCIELLAMRWLRREGREATAGKLADALTRAGLKNLADSLIKTEQGSKMSVGINELEEENLKLRARNKELEDTTRDSGDLEDISGVLTDTDQATKELRISERLKTLNQQLNTYVTSLLEVPEVKQDQLKTPIKLDLLTRLSERLQELYSDTQTMVSETCKCSKDLKRDLYDFAYHGLRTEHNELVHRVKDLESTAPEMCQKEREDFERLQKYQANRQRQVDLLDKVWRGLFSPQERLPKTPWSDTTGISDKSNDSKKASTHTDPGARSKQKKSHDARSKAPPVNWDDAKNEVCLNNLKLQARNKELEDTTKQQDSRDLEDISGVLTDTDQAERELRTSDRLKTLNKQLNTYVTSLLEVPEVKQDQLKTPVKLDLLTRLSKRLQELYSDTQIIVSETCKCSEDLKRDFYDFANHGLRAKHNELVHRVKDLESTVPEMCQEEKEDFERLQKYQVNRQRQVDRLDKEWRGCSSPLERLPKTPWSDTTGISYKSTQRKKVTKGKSVKNFFRKKENDEDACALDSCSVRRD